MKRSSKFSIYAMIILLLVYIPLHLVLPLQVSASKADSVSYENLSVYIMPQYNVPDGWEDRSTLFIGVYGTLKNNATDESINEIRLPYIESDGDFHLELVGDTVDEKIEPVEAEIDDTTREIVWQPNESIEPEGSYDFLAEYYLSIDDESTTYEVDVPYVLERDADIMDLLIFEPFNAEEFVVETNVENVEMTDQFGILVHKLDVGEATAETAIDVKLLYEKRDTITTMDAIGRLTEQAEQLAEASEAQAEAEADKLFTVENIVMAVLALVIIFILIVFIWRNRKRSKNQSQESN